MISEWKTISPCPSERALALCPQKTAEEAEEGTHWVAIERIQSAGDALAAALAVGLVRVEPAHLAPLERAEPDGREPVRRQLRVVEREPVVEDLHAAEVDAAPPRRRAGRLIRVGGRGVQR